MGNNGVRGLSPWFSGLLGAIIAFLAVIALAPVDGSVKVERVTDTVYVWKTDTAPVAKVERVVRYVRIPARPCQADTINDEGTRDSVMIPVTQKVYEDTCYTAWVSGYMPSLDSITVRQRVVTNTITITKTRDRRWSAGIVGGYGYGLRSKTVEPFVGVGVSCKLW